MGGRGAKGAIINPKNQNRWDWLQDVSDNRLKNYIKRSAYLIDKPDPTGRSIHDVGYWAEKELNRRKI